MNDTQPPQPAPAPSRLRQFFDHILHWGETYIVWPIFVLLIVAAIQAVHYFYQTDQVDDPLGALIHAANAMIPLVLLVSFVCFVQTLVIGWRGHLKKENALRDDLFDAAVFLALLWSFAKIAHVA